MGKRGRPRGFDRDLALQQAMEVFWAKGYDGAQVADLTAAIGIAPPSFYAAFASKEAAFLEAVDLYIERIASAPMRALEAAPTAREGVRRMLEGSVEVAVSNTPGGCLLILGVVNCLPVNEAARDRLAAARRTTVELIEARLTRGVREGDLPLDTNAGKISAFVHGVMQAISFQARDGASREELLALIDPAIAAL